jgi:serine/threonine protein kinase
MLLTGKAGTFHWMAPEVILNQRYDLKADIYSLAIVFWEVVCRKLPYEDIATPMIPHEVSYNNRRPNLNIIPSSAGSMRSLISKMWVRNPADRPDIHEVVRFLNTLS